MEEYYIISIPGYTDIQAPEYGKIFLIIDAEIKNIGKNTVIVNSIDFSASDSEGNRYDPEIIYSGADELGNFVELYQNQKKRGTVLFQVPRNVKGMKIYYDAGNIFSGTKLLMWTT